MNKPDHAWPEEIIVPLPKPFVDARGSIHPLVDVTMRSALLIHSKKGSVRANHYHKTDWHYCYVLSGSIQYHHRPVGSKAKPKVLNLFGYTGLASLAAARSGAVVTHLDASRKVVTWANENQTLSGLADLPIRWIIDDALKFVQREVRRGSKYQGIILDPPKFGRGPKGEVWEFYKLIPGLLKACQQILDPDPLFIQLTAYAVKASAATLFYAVDEMMHAFHGLTACGEIGLREKSANRFLSTAIYARWSKEKLA